MEKDVLAERKINFSENLVNNNEITLMEIEDKLIPYIEDFVC